MFSFKAYQCEFFDELSDENFSYTLCYNLQRNEIIISLVSCLNLKFNFKNQLQISLSALLNCSKLITEPKINRKVLTNHKLILNYCSLIRQRLLLINWIKGKKRRRRQQSQSAIVNSSKETRKKV